MTTTLSAAALRMPCSASVAAAAPLAFAAPAEPRAAKSAVRAANRPCGVEFGGIIAPAFSGRRGGMDGGDRFGSDTRPSTNGGWWHDQAQLAGGGPLRG
jgi:hypothetical protein